MKEEYRIDVSQKAVRNEQHVTQDGKNAECEYRRHAAAGEDRRRGAKAKAVDPMHRLSAPHSQHGLTGFFVVSGIAVEELPVRTNPPRMTTTAP
jgi:hypothetical protein